MLPTFKNIPVQTSFGISKFKGINITESYEPGEVTKCSNISTASHPAICSRDKRSVYARCNGIINGTGNFDGIFYTYYIPETGAMYLNFKGTDYEFTKVSNSDDPKQKRKFACLQNSIVVVPDNIVFFTDTLKFKTIDIFMQTSLADAAEKFKEESGGMTSIDPESHDQIGFVFHNSIVAHSDVYYYAGSRLVFYFMGFDSNIKKGDVLTIKMDVRSPSAESSDHYNEYIAKMKNGIVAKVKDVETVSHKTPAGTTEETIKLIFDDNAIDDGGYGDVYCKEITIEQKMPKTTNIASFNNRVWAVSGNTIYASKLGEADEWNDFSVDAYGTLPTSSYSTLAGSDGDFTAIIPHGNYIYALKENHIHKIYGDTPDDFALSGIDAPGPLANVDTVCVCGVNLMYASVGGVCVLRDGYPKIISENLGDIIPLCGASFNEKYYLICREGESKVMYVYDSRHDIWTMEESFTDADNLCSDGKNLYCSSGGMIVCLTSDSGEELEKFVSWSFKLRFDPGRFSPATSIRAKAAVKLEKDASFTVRAIYDDNTKGALCGFCYDETPNGCTNLQMPIKRDLGFYLEFKGIGAFTLRRIKFNYYKSDNE